MGNILVQRLQSERDVVAKTRSNISYMGVVEGRQLAHEKSYTTRVLEPGCGLQKKKGNPSQAQGERRWTKRLKIRSG
ncbi:hypothetical protein [Novosphingopyxis sp.]|uniref:hypothetical protein n=1 Tax=Novosphingopyxis sp. TaxID=2709690 RepID=UPI003B59B53C